MTVITLRVLDGADRGRVYADLAIPVTIGREEGNSVQLNDERISRYHIKIQEDQDKIVLTDLESTNGTRVNGEDTHLRILRFGDVIDVGRSKLLYGTREQISARLEALKAAGAFQGDGTDLDRMTEQAESAGTGQFEQDWNDSEQLRSTLHIPSAPELPQGLSPGQAAEVSELLEYLHLRARSLVQGLAPPDREGNVAFNYEQWQDLLDIQSQLAEYLQRIGDPDGE